jgi:hypothetical protein
MTVDEAINRGNNLTATAILTISGFAFLPEVFVEDEWWFKLDDLVIFLIGLRALTWYLKGNNRYTASNAPFYLTLAALVWKVIAIILEFHDPADLGDDLGALILFLLATILVWKLRPKKISG